MEGAGKGPWKMGKLQAYIIRKLYAAKKMKKACASHKQHRLWWR
jgi:hypothetical protein